LKKFWTLFFSLLIGFVIQAESFHDMLKEADALVNFPGNDFQAEYTIVQDIPAEGRITTVAAVFRRDSRNTYSIVIKEPVENRGQGYLKQGEILWVYDPESRQFNSSSSSERFQNTNARNSDFTQSTLAEDYRVVKGERGRLGSYNCWILELEGLSDDLSYPKMKIWISEDSLVRKTEDYSLSGQLLRSSIFPSYHRLGDRYFPHKMLIVDLLAGAEVDGKFVNERTQVTIENPSLADLPDRVFSKSFLERVNQ